MRIIPMMEKAILLSPDFKYAAVMPINASAVNTSSTEANKDGGYMLPISFAHAMIANAKPETK